MTDTGPTLSHGNAGSQDDILGTVLRLGLFIVLIGLVWITVALMVLGVDPSSLVETSARPPEAAAWA